MSSDNLNPDLLQLKLRHINPQGQVEAVYEGGNLTIVVQSGGFDDNAIHGTNIKVYPAEGEAVEPLATYNAESEPSPARLINIVNHLLNKRTLNTYNISLELLIEAESEVAARESVKQLIFFANRESLADWNIMSVEEQDE